MLRLPRVITSALLCVAGLVAADAGTIASAAVPGYAWRMRTYDFTQSGYYFTTGSVDAADVNGDGRTDIVAGLEELGDAWIGVLPHLADGSFGDLELTPVANPEGGGFSVVVATGDLDDDGDTDVAASASGGVDLLLQKPDGSLGNHRFIAGAYYDPKPVDWDGDGDLEMLVVRGTETGELLSLLTRQGDGSWVENDLTIDPRSIGSWDLEDFNGDGRMDIVTTGWPGTAVHRHLAGGSVVSTTPDIGTDGHVDAGDVDGDDRADLVVVSGATYVFSGNGDMSFDPGVMIAESYTAVALGDLNNDDRPDLVHAGQGFLPRLQGSDGTFGSLCEDFTTDAYSFRKPTIVDADDDGRADVFLPTTGQAAFVGAFGAAKGTAVFPNLDAPEGERVVGYPIEPHFGFFPTGTCPVASALGQTLDLMRSDNGGPAHVVDSIVTAEPWPVLSDIPHVPGEYVYFVRWAGGAQHVAAESDAWAVSAVPEGNELTLTHVDTSLTYGGSTNYTVKLKPVAFTDNHSVDIYARPKDGSEYYVETLTVDAETGIAVGESPAFRRNTTLTAVWEGDEAWPPIDAMEHVQVSVDLSGRLYRFHHRVGETYVYRPGVDPVFGASVAPASAGEKIAVFVERRRDGGWRSYLRGSADIRRGGIAILIPHQFLDRHVRYRVNARHGGEGSRLRGATTKWFNFVVD